MAGAGDSSLDPSDPARRVIDLAEVLAAGVEFSEANRRISDDVHEALRANGAYWCMVPVELGGEGFTPYELAALTVELATVDASAAWLVGQSAAFVGLVMVRARDDFVAELSADPGASIAGSLMPGGTAALGDGAYTVAGRWGWASGAHHARFIGAFSLPADEATAAEIPIGAFMFLDPGTVRLHGDSWDTMGMRGTGSVDFTVEAVDVARHRMVDFLGPARRSDLALGRISAGVWWVALAAAAVQVGTAKRALDATVALIADKVPYGGSRTQLSSQAVQREVSEALARLDAARNQLDAAAHGLWELACSERSFTPSERASVRLKTTHAARLALTVVETAYDVAGGSAIHMANVWQQCLRDARTLAQQGSIYPRSYELAGRVALGVDEDNVIV